MLPVVVGEVVGGVEFSVLHVHIVQPDKTSSTRHLEGQDMSTAGQSSEKNEFTSTELLTFSYSYLIPQKQEQKHIFTLPMFSATMNIRKILTSIFR